MDILDHLKRHNPNQIIVAFSGQSFDLSKQRFFSKADDVLPKPVNALKCKDVLDQLIEAKFTLEHMWNSIVTLMQRENVPAKAIDRLEGKITKVLSDGGHADYASIVSTVISRAELAGKVAGAIGKIAALFSLGA